MFWICIAAWSVLCTCAFDLGIHCDLVRALLSVGCRKTCWQRLRCTGTMSMLKTGCQKRPFLLNVYGRRHRCQWQLGLCCTSLRCRCWKPSWMMTQTWQTCTWLAVLKWLQLLLLPMLHNRGMSPTEQPAPLVHQMHLDFVNSLPHTLMLLNLYMLMPDLAHAQCLCCLCVRPRHNTCLSDAVCSCYCSPSYSVPQASMCVDSLTTLATLLVPALWSQVSSEVPNEQTDVPSQTDCAQMYAQTCDEKCGTAQSIKQLGYCNVCCVPQGLEQCQIQVQFPGMTSSCRVNCLSRQKLRAVQWTMTGSHSSEGAALSTMGEPLLHLY